jgi:hypothetical protein
MNAKRDGAVAEFGALDGAPKTSPWRPSWIIPAVALLVAMAFQDLKFAHAAPKPEGRPLADVVRVAVPGWSYRDVPLGPNEFLSNEAEKVLNFDDVVNREFSGGGRSFGVFAAYWSAGKMPTQLVASHTPDRCWTENGWKCTEMRFRQSKAFEDGELQPAEWRRFEPPNGGVPVYVLYWHLVGGRAYNYGGHFNAVPDPLHWWKSALQQVLVGSREQYFIRITSSEPIESLWDNKGFVELIHGLKALGLSEKA